jgi:hypothetical protein
VRATVANALFEVIPVSQAAAAAAAAAEGIVAACSSRARIGQQKDTPHVLEVINMQCRVSLVLLIREVRYAHHLPIMACRPTEAEELKLFVCLSVSTAAA